MSTTHDGGIVFHKNTMDLKREEGTMTTSTLEAMETTPQSRRDSETKMEPIKEASLAFESEASATVEEESKVGHRSLTWLEIRNLTLILLAWACTICNVTLVVGTSAVVMLSIDGDDSSLTTLPLGAFFLGASMVSLVAPRLFRRGRRFGFLTATLGFGLLGGTGLGATSIVVASPLLLILSCAWFGAAAGIGFQLRFAATQVVPEHWAARAVTLVVSGGCIAAFAGPESARATRDAFGNYEFLGVFVMTGIFNVCNALFASFVQFPTVPKDDDKAASVSRTELVHFLKRREFVVPLLLASLSWTIMALPMSLVRVAMQEVGYTSRQSLTTVELHFLGMYAPGFVSGSLISRYGPPKVCGGAILVFAAALVVLLLTGEEGESSNGVAVWIVGLILVGIGWNFGFTASTVWTTQLYAEAPSYSTMVQAANDCGMFALAGVWIFSGSYIYEAGGGALEGWKTLNWTVVGLLGLMTTILGVDRYLEWTQQATIRENEPSDHDALAKTMTDPDASKESMTDHDVSKEIDRAIELA